MCLLSKIAFPPNVFKPRDHQLLPSRALVARMRGLQGLAARALLEAQGNQARKKGGGADNFFLGNSVVSGSTPAWAFLSPIEF